MSYARKTAETSPSTENNIALKHASAKFNKTRNEARTKSWMKKTADLDMEKDDTKLWRLTRQLNDEGTRRPISLTSCVVKLLERIINAQMKWYLESEQLLAPQQAGFREHHCTEDQTTYLAHAGN